MVVVLWGFLLKGFSLETLETLRTARQGKLPFQGKYHRIPVCTSTSTYMAWVGQEMDTAIQQLFVQLSRDVNSQLLRKLQGSKGKL